MSKLVVFVSVMVGAALRTFVSRAAAFRRLSRLVPVTARSVPFGTLRFRAATVSRTGPGGACAVVAGRVARW